jgi:hypothetical protein
MQQKATSAMEINAIVGAVFSDKGYAIAYPEKEQHGLTEHTSISFSLTAWPSSEVAPSKGQCVTLSDVKQFARGWRATHVQPVNLPSMEQKK